ncbi:MAG: Uma2 family endonuclease [Acidobacteriota bacterium]|nr:Uma2 family endonuclease [Acidobacteriota bacterium]
MTTSTLVPLSEYLSTTYRPDRDFLEGELLERNMGEHPHARIQIILGTIFETNRKAWNVRPSTEQRVQVRPERFRIPDICVQRRGDPQDLIVTVAPLLCIEVLSSADTLRSLQARANDYAAMGVEHIWAVDPWDRLGYYASARGFIQPEDGVLRVPSTPIAVSLAEIFAELDED